jgi:Tfp pilus assembly protein PilF
MTYMKKTTGLNTNYRPGPDGAAAEEKPPVRVGPEAITSLDQAIRLHQAGDFLRAERLYRDMLERDPFNTDALHLLGVLAHQTGNSVAAAALIRQAIARRPDVAIYHSNLGEAFRASGQVEAAITEYETAIRLNSAFADAHGNLGAALATVGRTTEAIESLQRAVRLKPDFPAAHMNLGVALHSQGLIAQAADSFRRAVTMHPAFAEAHINLGNALKELQQPDEAVTHYREAIRLRPELVAAHLNLANLLTEQERFTEARMSYHRVFELEHAGRLRNTAAFVAPEPPTAQTPTLPLQTTPFELTNIAEHVEYLIDIGKLDRSFAQLAAAYRSLLEEIDPALGSTDTVTLNPAQVTRIAEFHRQIVHYSDAPRVTASAVNAQLDFRRIEEQYLASRVAVVHFDDFLSPAALRGLRDFCLQSTIFFGRDRAGTLQSYVGAGFDCSLLFQIVEELKARFPRILGKQVLRNMWVYRYPHESSGVNLHTDNGSVTFNFWLTPDDANINPGGSGLVVYAKEQPLDWDWARLNRDKDDPRVEREIKEFLGSAQKVIVPYRENRAVLFHSNLFHQSDSFRFKQGYPNRRMNVTLLFGDRGSDARLQYIDAGSP